MTTARSTAQQVIGRRRRTINARTESHILKRRQIYCRRHYKGAILTSRQRRNRRQWARTQELDQCCFSDESKFNLSFADGRTRVYSWENERFSDNGLFGGRSVMVWGAINTNCRTRTRLVIVGGTLTSRRCIDEILQPVVVPVLRRNRQANQLTF